MATCTRILTNITLGIILVIILTVIGGVIYVWVTCPSLARCGFNLILGRGLAGGKTVSDEDYFASMQATGRGKNVEMSRSSDFDSKLWAPGAAGENTDPSKLFAGTKSLDEGPHTNVGGKPKSKDANEPTDVTGATTPKKRGGTFDKMGSTFDEW